MGAGGAQASGPPHSTRAGVSRRQVTLGHRERAAGQAGAQQIKGAVGQVKGAVGQGVCRRTSRG